MKTNEKAGSDYLMWVGSMFYPTVDSFILEAEERGPCKRMGRLPRNLVLGQSRIFLAHDDGIVGEGFIFGYFVPNALEYLVEFEAQLPDTLYDKVDAVYLKELNEDARLCGDRRMGLYMAVRPEKEVQGSFVIFDKPRKLSAFDPERKHFRGLLEISYGDPVVNAKKKSIFMDPPSRNAAKPKEVPADPWTEEEDEAIVEALQDATSKAREACRLSYKTGRTKTAILYRYHKLVGDEAEEEGGDED